MKGKEISIQKDDSTHYLICGSEREEGCELLDQILSTLKFIE